MYSLSANVDGQTTGELWMALRRHLGHPMSVGNLAQCHHAHCQKSKVSQLLNIQMIMSLIVAHAF